MSMRELAVKLSACLKVRPGIEPLGPLVRWTWLLVALVSTAPLLGSE